MHGDCAVRVLQIIVAERMRMNEVMKQAVVEQLAVN